MSFVGGDWLYYGRFKEATHPLKTLSGDNAFCSDQCNRDALCNAYSIDTSTNGCYLSSCTSYTSVPECYDCLFANKNPPSSLNICTPTPTTKIAPATKMVNITTSFTTTFPPKTMSSKTTTPIKDNDEDYDDIHTYDNHYTYDNNGGNDHTFDRNDDHKGAYVRNGDNL